MEMVYFTCTYKQRTEFFPKQDTKNNFSEGSKDTTLTCIHAFLFQA